MNQKHVLILLWLILLQAAPVSSVFSAVPPEGWKALRTNLHINEKTLTRLDGDTVSAWIYLVPRKGSNTLHAAKQQLKYMMKPSNDLEYIGHLSEIDCKRSLYRKLTTVFFRDDSNIIASHYWSSADWREIGDDNIFHDVYQAVCGLDNIAIRFDPEND